MTDADTENALLELVMSRQSAGFDQVFAMFYRPLCLFAAGLIQSEPDAEDIIQGIFIKFWEKEHDFDSFASLRAFLYVSTRNACFNYLEARQVRTKHHRIISTESPVDNTTMLQHLIKTEVLRQVLDEVDRLPEKCREVIRLTFIDGLSAKEIADQLKVTVSTVNNQKMRGVHLLRDRLSDGQMGLLLLIFPEILRSLK